MYCRIRRGKIYADIRANSGISIPCFVLKDGTVTRDLEAVLK